MTDAARPALDPRRLRELYRQKRNILQTIREESGQETNDPLAILVAYDLQAGSYLARLDDPAAREVNDVNTAKFARLFEELGAASLLHPGTGEGKTLCHVVEKMAAAPRHVFGFDIALSRVMFAARHARALGQNAVRFFTGNMLEIPIRDNAFDVVFTSHSMEPNGGREEALLRELYRVADRYLVLREPSWELGGAETRAHIERHRYVRGIPETARRLGYDVVEHRAFGDDENPRNVAALTVIRKRDGAASAPAWVADGHPYASPLHKEPLAATGGAYYAADDALAFPIVAGIPCLLAENGIFSTRFLAALDE